MTGDADTLKMMQQNPLNQQYAFIEGKANDAENKVKAAENEDNDGMSPEEVKEHIDQLKNERDELREQLKKLKDNLDEQQKIKKARKPIRRTYDDDDDGADADASTNFLRDSRDENISAQQRPKKRAVR